VLLQSTVDLRSLTAGPKVVVNFESESKTVVTVTAMIGAVEGRLPLWITLERPTE
jgi:hypothetical protein